ncbi:ribonuclease TUDOR 1-like [Apium graveolens]|uniref:ribonuclease TUDOR 1-like n=1 Tax=Apium graveolens TaxID=4045 RepID=UPI003D7BB1C9
MASRAIRAKAISRGIVKAVPSGDTLVIMEMGNTASTEIPTERTIILSSLMAPKLARRGDDQSTDEPFAWQSREFLRRLCIGKEVGFQVDYTLSSRGLEFGTVFLDDKNVAFWIVAHGWAKLKTVRDQDKDKGGYSPFLKELKKWEDKAKDNGAGCWSKSTAGSVRDLPSSLVGDPYSTDEMIDIVEEYRGTEIKAIVDYVRDGSTLHVYLLPEYHHVRLFVAGVQAPLVRNRIVEPVKTEANGKPSKGSEANGKPSKGSVANGKPSKVSGGPLTSAQKVVTEANGKPSDGSGQKVVAPEDFGRASKHFTEIRVLHRDVRIVLEGVAIDNERRGKLIGRVCYLDGHRKDLAEQLVENGLAKFVDCGTLLPADIKRRLKSSELEAKRSRLRMWKNYTSPPTDTRAIIDQKFTGEVVEVISGDCIVVATDSSTKRRVYLSSIWCPRGKARDVLKEHLLGHQVHVSMEYSRKDQKPGSQNNPAAEERVKEYGSVFLESQSVSAQDAPLAPPTAVSQHHKTNVAEMMVTLGYAEVIRHRNSELRSDHYDALLDAEYHAKEAAKKQSKHSKIGMQSVKKYVDRQDVSNGHAARRKPIEKSQKQDNNDKGQEVSGSQAIERTPKEELQVVVKEVLGGGRFYVQAAADRKMASIIQQKLASLRLQEPPAIGSYNPKKGDLVIAQFSQDNSWYRAMIVDAPKGPVRSAKAKFEVLYIDYGTQEFVAYSRLRPSDCYSLPSSPGLAKLCSLAHVKVPDWKEDYGKEAACCLSDYILKGQELKAIVEDRDDFDRTGTNHIVTLMDTKSGLSINAHMLKRGFARVDNREQEDESVKQKIDKLKMFENEARKARLGMWRNDNDDDEKNSS